MIALRQQVSKVLNKNRGHLLKNKSKDLDRGLFLSWRSAKSLKSPFSGLFFGKKMDRHKVSKVFCILSLHTENIRTLTFFSRSGTKSPKSSIYCLYILKIIGH